MKANGSLLLGLVCLLLAGGCTGNPVATVGAGNGKTSADSLSTVEAPTLVETLKGKQVNTLVDQLLISFPDTRTQYLQYVAMLADSARLRTESGIFQTFEVRDSLAKSLQPVADLLNEGDLWEVYDSLEAALNPIGLTAIVVESFLTGFGPSPMLGPQIRRTGSKDLAAYSRFLDAESESMKGEYPYSDLSSMLEMIRAGEALKKKTGNRYYPLIRDRFRKVLVTFCDFHYVRGDNGEQGSAMLTGVGTSPYPYLTETETYQQYVSSGELSPYRKVIAGILSIASEIGFQADTVYVLEVAVYDEEAAGLNQLYQYLDAGKDVVHLLPVQGPVGKTNYVLAYRFFSSLLAAKEIMQKRAADLPALKLKPYFLRNDALHSYP